MTTSPGLRVNYCFYTSVISVRMYWWCEATESVKSVRMMVLVYNSYELIIESTWLNIPGVFIPCY